MNHVLIAYIQAINPSIETCVPLPKNTGATSKKQKESKKQAMGSPSKPEQVEKVVKTTSQKVVKSDQPSKKIQKPVVEESFLPAKEVIPSKSGILKRLKKVAHRPSLSP